MNMMLRCFNAIDSIEVLTCQKLARLLPCSLKVSRVLTCFCQAVCILVHADKQVECQLAGVR
jgi:hypothetical protein